MDNDIYPKWHTTGRTRISPDLQRAGFYEIKMVSPTLGDIFQVALQPGEIDELLIVLQSWQAGMIAFQHETGTRP